MALHLRDLRTPSPPALFYLLCAGREGTYSCAAVLSASRQAAQHTDVI
jgi:hypothetical protein